MVAKDLH